MTDIWQRLEGETLPILLYGTGNGADKIVAELYRRGIKVSGVFASDGFVRHREYKGFPVMSLSEAEENFSEFVALFSFGSDRVEVLDNIKRIMSRHTLLAPEVPVAGGEIFDIEFARRHESELRAVYSMLCDEKSKITFRETTLFKLDGDISHLFAAECDKSEPFSLLDISCCRSFLDLGAYNGDTAEEFAELSPQYSHITAVEPDQKSFAKLLRNTNGLRISCINAAVSDRIGKVPFSKKASRGSSVGEGVMIDAVSVDSICREQSFDYIKFDVEGAEFSALCGAEATILRDRPRMRVAAYHKSEDYFKLPLKVAEIRPDYKLYMRHLPAVPAWDTDFFFL